MTSHDSVHDVLVNKKSNAMLVFILFSTEENLVSFISCCLAKVLPSHLLHLKPLKGRHCVADWLHRGLEGSIPTRTLTTPRDIEANTAELMQVANTNRSVELDSSEKWITGLNSLNQMNRSLL